MIQQDTNYDTLITAATVNVESKNDNDEQRKK